MAADTEMGNPGPSAVRWLFAAIWLVFLIYPTAALITSDHSPALKVYGFTLLGVFVVVYLAACIMAMPFRRGSPRPLWIPMVFFAALSALAVGSTPALGLNAAAFVPYLMALAAFCFAIGAAVAVVIGLGVGAIGVQLLVTGTVDIGLAMSVLATATVLLASRFAQRREVALSQAEDERRRLDEQVAILAERDRVARDVHDVLGHTLTVMTVKTELALRLVDVDPKRAKTELAEIHSMSRQALAEVRSTVGGLRTPDLKAELASAATALAAAEIEADLPESATELPVGRATLFAWVIRESVTNVVRHSGAQRCRIVVDSSSVEVRDDGRGMPETIVGTGLRGLRDRVVGAGGQLRIDSTGPGTAVRVLMP